MFMNEWWNITMHIWNTKEEHMLKLIPHESHKSELHHFINSLPNCTTERRAHCHTIPLLLSFQTSDFRTTYKWFTITLNRTDLWEYRSTKRGAVITTQELKTKDRKQEPIIFSKGRAALHLKFVDNQLGGETCNVDPLNHNWRCDCYNVGSQPLTFCFPFSILKKTEFLLMLLKQKWNEIMPYVKGKM